MAFSALATLRPILLAGLLVLTQSAWAELMLHPTRLVFDKNQRAAQIELINNGSTPTTYRISLVNRRMTESGQFEAIDAPAPGEQFADPMLRYSPRQITLQPGSAQTVRVMLRKPAELADGEYRSHLQFELLPEVEGASSIESQPGGKDIGVVLNTLVGASVPVIVRHGGTNATMRLSGLALAREGKQPVLSLQFEREGNSSVYGDLAVTFTPRGGKPQQLALVGGIAVYTPNRVRKAAVPLQAPNGTALAHGTIEVSYHDRPEAGGKLLSQASLELP
jgi:P pilus assembly chaperone PapD